MAAETIHVRGEGGSVIAMDLPLPHDIAARYDAGLIVRVNVDGSEWSGAALPPEKIGAVPESAPTDPAAAPVRPAVAAKKADWVAYVVATGALAEADAEKLNKDELIATYGG